MMGGMKLNLLFVAIGMALLLTAAEAWAQTATDLKCKGCVSKGDLSKGAVATKSLKSRAVKASKIANNAVTGDKIADGAVAGEKIADGAVAMSKLSNDVILPLQVVDATGLFLGFILGANDVLIHADDTTFVLAVGKNSLSSNVQAWFEDTACTANPFIRNDQESNSAQLAPQAAVAGPVVYLPTGPAAFFDAQSFLESDGTCSVDSAGSLVGSGASIVVNFDPTKFTPPFRVKP